MKICYFLVKERGMDYISIRQIHSLKKLHLNAMLARDCSAKNDQTCTLSCPASPLRRRRLQAEAPSLTRRMAHAVEASADTPMGRMLAAKALTEHLQRGDLERVLSLIFEKKSTLPIEALYDPCEAGHEGEAKARPKPDQSKGAKARPKPDQSPTEAQAP